MVLYKYQIQFHHIKHLFNKNREAAKKVLLLMAGPLRGGGRGVKARPLRKKNFYFYFVPTDIKVGGRGGGEGLNGPAIKRRTFLRLPIRST